MGVAIIVLCSFLKSLDYRALILFLLRQLAFLYQICAPNMFGPEVQVSPMGNLDFVVHPLVCILEVVLECGDNVGVLGIVLRLVLLGN